MIDHQPDVGTSDLKASSEGTSRRRLAVLETSARLRHGVFQLVSGALLAVAVVRSWDAVAGLHWPHDLDLLRNIASGVAFRDGHVLADPHYAGVPAWFSPLTSALLAATSFTTSVSISRLGTQAGVFLNVITPIALLWLTTRWFGRRTAICALPMYLFVIGDGYSAFAVVSYSPWLVVALYALGIFLFALGALDAALSRRRTKDALALGVLTGLLALAHPGAIFILAAIIVVQFVLAAWRARRGDWRTLVRVAVVSGTTAAVVAAPFWLPVVVRYRGRVVNDVPSTLGWLPLRTSHFWEFLGDFFWRWPFLVIAIGVPAWFVNHARGRPPIPERGMDPSARGVSILATWTVIALIGLPVATYRPQWFPMPSYHFLLYLSAALCIWFGVAVSGLVDVATRGRNVALPGLVTGVIVALICAWGYPRWNDALASSRRDAVEFAEHFDDLAVVPWIRSNTERDDVFLHAGGANFFGDGIFVQFFPGLAGRHSVNIESAEFSSPWVEWQPRHDDARAMIEALRSCDVDRFQSVGERYGNVRYMIAPAPVDAGFAKNGCPEVAPVAYRDERVVIRRVWRSSRDESSG